MPEATTYSPFSSLFMQVMRRIKTLVPGIRWIDQELGQLEADDRPAVSWPCVLLDLDGFGTSQLAGNIQLLEGQMVVRLGFDSWSQTNSSTPETWRLRGLAFYELEWELNKALHGWRPDGFSAMVRVSAGTEKREDNIRVREMRYQVGFEDRSAEPGYETLGGITDFNEDFAWTDFGGSMPTLVVTN